MPELAEVAHFRKCWNPGLGQTVLRVHWREGKRVFRGTDCGAFDRLIGKKLIGSEAAGKQMLFRFGKDHWLGIHLGMTGKMSVEKADHSPGKHDHLVIFQKRQALIFSDPRQFGRIQAHEGQGPPDWWTKIAPAVTSAEFTFAKMSAFLDRRARRPVKAALLVQEAFPGIGNWMADEILWRAGIAPARPCRTLDRAERKILWREVRQVARIALKTIGHDFGDPPAGWLIHHRWGRGGACPKHKGPLHRETIGGRTTAWCSQCQN